MAERALQVVAGGRRDREMPWHEEAEVCTLGACMMKLDAIDEAAAIVSEGDFFREPHRMIFGALRALAERRMPPDPATLQAELEVRGQLVDVGGLTYLLECSDAVATAANVAYHARLVRDAARRRQLIEAGTEIVRNAYEPEGLPVSTLVERAEQLVASCAEETVDGSVRVKDELWGVIEHMERVSQNPGQLVGISWGLAEVDDWTGGLHGGDLVIVAARPSMGKTAFVTGVGLQAAIAHQVPTAFFSLEMSRRQIVQRMLCSEALVDLSRLLRGQLLEDDFGRLAQASGHLNRAPIWIDDTGGLSTATLRAKLRRIAQAEPSLGLVIVDYVQLMSGAADTENRQQEVSQISRGLKSIAKEFDVPIIALSQLSRAPETRSNHRPQLSDLRESGSLEQDADLVAFLFREEYYLSTDEAREKNKIGAAELIVSKQRNGPTGTIDLHFRKECARFEDGRPLWGNR